MKGIGRKKAFKVLKRKIKDISKLKELGDKVELPNELIRTCESFICQLYEIDLKNNDINTLRFKHFVEAQSKIICCHLALISMQLLPSPVGYGWTKEVEEDDELHTTSANDPGISSSGNYRTHFVPVQGLHV